jgi:hypothetical protein
LQQYPPKPEVASAWRYLLVTSETSLKMGRTTIHELISAATAPWAFARQIASSARVHLISS